MRIICGMLGRCRCAADIGTDHGLVPVYLVMSGQAERVILSDIARRPLERALENVRKYCPQEGIPEALSSEGVCSCGRFSFRLGAGLEVLSACEADAIIIAGMGGETICDILSERPDIARSAERLVLQPRSMCAELRRWLTSNGYSITDERIAEENGHIAQMICAVPRADAAGAERFDSDIFYTVPPLLIENRDPMLPAFLDMLVSQAETVLSGVAGAQKDAELLTGEWSERLKELNRIRESHEKEGNI